MSHCNSLLLSYLLCFFSLYLIFLPHRASGSSRGLFPDEIDDNHTSAPPPGGLCSVAVTTYGYKCQEFQVTTGDGYILGVARIPEGRVGSKGSNRTPVLLQHGLLVDGATWLLNSPEESLAMMLADNGFDVWISNTRGTRFSRKHVSIDPNDPDFWDWTWDDLVTYDFPAVVDFVFKHTCQKIHYVGHSLGTLVPMASLSQGKNVHDKLKSAAFLCPVAYLSHMTTPIGDIAAKTFVGEMLDTMFGLAEFNPTSEPVGKLLKTLCALSGLDCYDLLPLITGSNCCLNGSTVETFLKFEPQSTATKNLVHLAQTVRDGVLSKYDYGTANNNMEHYGESIPPRYDLTKIPRDLPLFLSYGGRDSLSDVRDVATLLDILKSHDQDKLEVQYVENYAHVDFIMGVNAKDVVYNRVISFFGKF